MSNLTPDFSKENQYEFECAVCGEHFLCHKGRCVCDGCKQAKEDLDGVVPLHRDKSF